MDTEVVVLRTSKPVRAHGIDVQIVGKAGNIEEYQLLQARVASLDGAPVNIFQRPEFVSIAGKLRACSWLLDDICKITQGSKPFQTGKGKPPQTKQILKDKPFVSECKKDGTFRPLLRGRLIHKWRVLWAGNYWISLGDWLAEPRYSANYDAPEKIVIRQTGDSLIAAMDNQQFVVRDNLYTIASVDTPLHLAYVLALLNSRLLNWFYQHVLNPERGEALAQVKRGHLAKLPIREINFESGSDTEAHGRMVQLANTMLDLNKQLQSTELPDEKIFLERQIASTDKQIDALVYELYGLTDEEVKLVEGES